MDLRERVESLKKMIEALSLQDHQHSGGQANGGRISGSQAGNDQVSNDQYNDDQYHIEGNCEVLDPRETPEGVVRARDELYPLGYAHGRLEVGSALSVPQDVVRVLARDPDSRVDIERAVFLDLETNGLAGGAGTFAFLAGAGRFESGQFVLTHLFLDDPSCERAFLAGLAPILEQASMLVTFNGKSFDLPLLQTRYTLNRMRFPVRSCLHLDLLPPSRRLWSRMLDSCALSCLEREVLGVFRDGDVPGWMIPSIYSEYLRRRDPRPIQTVIDHNRSDILSLTVLLSRVAACFQPSCAEREPSEALGAALQCDSAGCREMALPLYEEAAEAAALGEVSRRALWGAFRIARSSGAAERCLEIATRLTAESPDPYAWIEIAKYHEHKRRDFARALAAAKAALDIARTSGCLTAPAKARLEREISHRIARLERKAGHDGSPY